MKRGIWAILALPFLTIPSHAAQKPIYHDCRPSEDIVNGRTVHKTVCQNENGDWIEVRPERKKPVPMPVPASTAKPVKKPVYRDCRPAQDIVNGQPVWKAICQNEAGAWVEKPGNY